MAYNDGQQRRQQHNRDRAELLGESSTLTNRSRDTYLDISGDGPDELAVHSKLQQSHSAVDDLIAQGMGVLGSLRNQHDSLRGAKRKVFEIGQTLGLSTTTLQMIERRLGEDWLIFLVLAFLFIVFMYCFYRWWKI